MISPFPGSGGTKKFALNELVFTHFKLLKKSFLPIQRKLKKNQYLTFSSSSGSLCTSLEHSLHTTFWNALAEEKEIKCKQKRIIESQ